MRVKDAFDYTVYLAVRTLLSLAGILPLSVAGLTGRIIGSVAYLIGGERKAIALENIERALGADKTRSEIRCIARAFYANLGLFVMEFARLATVDKPYVERYIKFEGLEYLNDALKQGRGVLALTAHFDNWELLAIAMTIKGYPLNFLARPLDNRYLESYLNSVRTRLGSVVIDKSEALRPMLRALAGGAIIGVLHDQRASSKEGVSVDFFGTPALTNKGLAALVGKTGVPVVPVFIVREGGFNHRIICEPPVKTVKTGSRERDIVENTQKFAAAIESIIRRYPEQWFWLHSRWERRKKRRRRRRREVL